MVSLGIGLNGRARPQWWPAVADYALDFVSHRCMVGATEVAPAAAYTLTRSTAAAMADGLGNWQSFAAGALRRISGMGAVIEPGATNLVRASDNIGGAGWTAPPSQLTRSGDANGGWQFTVNVAHSGFLATEQSFSTIAAGNVVHFGFDLHEAGLGKAGVWNPLSGYAAFFDATTGLASGANASMVTAGGGWWRCRWFIAAGASLSAFRIRLGNSAASLDHVPGQFIRLRAPQIETTRRSSYFANASTSAGAMRDGDMLSLALPSGTHDLHLRYASGAEQELSGVSGPYVVDPAVLNESMVVGVWGVKL